MRALNAGAAVQRRGWPGGGSAAASASKQPVVDTMAAVEGSCRLECSARSSSVAAAAAAVHCEARTCMATRTNSARTAGVASPPLQSDRRSRHASRLAVASRSTVSSLRRVASSCSSVSTRCMDSCTRSAPEPSHRDRSTCNACARTVRSSARSHICRNSSDVSMGTERATSLAHSCTTSRTTSSRAESVSACSTCCRCWVTCCSTYTSDVRSSLAAFSRVSVVHSCSSASSAATVRKKAERTTSRAPRRGRPRVQKGGGKLRQLSIGSSPHSSGSQSNVSFKCAAFSSSCSLPMASTTSKACSRIAAVSSANALRMYGSSRES
mmetsp:Transcript_12956/g.47370  ORF Transcript_12956/g.47370 Transcript_12956/m.47370 type:complete len:324 (+) Transcript_12956:127-1098(+)